MLPSASKVGMNEHDATHAPIFFCGGVGLGCDDEQQFWQADAASQRWRTLQTDVESLPHDVTLMMW